MILCNICLISFGYMIVQSIVEAGPLVRGRIYIKALSDVPVIHGFAAELGFPRIYLIRL